MMQSDVDHTLFAGGNAGDDKLFVKFENKAVKDKAAYDDVFMRVVALQKQREALRSGQTHDDQEDVEQ